MKKHLVAVTVFCIFSLSTFTHAGTDGHKPGAKERCPVCGMFVAKYSQWLASLTLESGEILYFDGVKDMMAYFLAPQEFGQSAEITVTDVQVTEYYSQKWIDGKKAIYVVGSDVMGPMGHELIPFASDGAAKNFMKDHHGREILSFSAITHDKISSMRMGHKMK